jgi:glycosyltransferase involved in cell wall biosynthesis
MHLARPNALPLRAPSGGRGRRSYSLRRRRRSEDGRATPEAARSQPHAAQASPCAHASLLPPPLSRLGPLHAHSRGVSTRDLDGRSPVGSRPHLAGPGDAGSEFLAPPAGRIEPGPVPTFSVIIAAYNVANVIGDALESVEAQTVAPLEVIVCDDGSTDDLTRVLEPYRDTIVLLRRQNGGEAAAKNTAAAAATGDFVAILDADDVYFPNRLKALSALAQARPDLDILTTDGFLSVGDRIIRRNYDRSWQFEAGDQRRAILERNFIFGLAAVRRERLEQHGGFDEAIRWTTDWDLWLRLILAGARAGCVPEPLALYRLRETSLTAQRRDLLLGKLATLEKAEHNSNLQGDEPQVLERSLASYRRDLALLDLREAVAAGKADARRRALDVLGTPGYRFRNRLDALAMVIAPAVSGRILRRRAQRTWIGAGGVRVRRTADKPHPGSGAATP